MNYETKEKLIASWVIFGACIVAFLMFNVSVANDYHVLLSGLFALLALPAFFAAPISFICGIVFAIKGAIEVEQARKLQIELERQRIQDEKERRRKDAKEAEAERKRIAEERRIAEEKRIKEEAMIAAAKQGDPQAQFDLSIYYEKENDFSNYVRWLKLAVQKNHAEAKRKLAEHIKKIENDIRSKEYSIKYLIDNKYKHGSIAYDISYNSNRGNIHAGEWARNAQATREREIQSEINSEEYALQRLKKELGELT